MFRVGICLDFVRLTTRTTRPHGAHVRGARRNRSGRHRGGIERRTRRTPVLHVPVHVEHEHVQREAAGAVVLLAEKSGNVFRVGIFLDFASSTARAPRGACVRMSGRNRIDRHRGEIERPATRTSTIFLTSQLLKLNQRVHQIPRAGLGTIAILPPTAM